VKDDIQLKSGLHIKTGTHFHFDFLAFHMNEQDWKTPTKFIPERFDIKSD
jgi:cytochrome P450